MKSRLILLALVAIAALLEFSRPINHDVAWGLTVVDLMHGGSRLYTDIVEINPPLMFWSMGALRAVASWLHVSADALYRAAVLLLGLWSAVQVSRSAYRLEPAIALLVGGLILVGPDFGQRDVLVGFLVAPYVVETASRERPDQWVPRGLAAGVGFCLKPQYLGIWVLMLLWRGWRRTDGAVAITGVFYLGLVYWLAPAFFILARALGPTYTAWRHVPRQELFLSPTVLLTVLALGVVASSRRNLAPCAWAFALSAIGAALAMVIQAKPFTYHHQPALTFAAIALVAAIPGASTVYRSAITAIALLVVVDFALIWRRRLPDIADEHIVASLVSRAPPSSRVVLLSEILHHGPAPFRMVHRQWLLPVPCLWWMKPIGAIPDSLGESLSKRLVATLDSADVILMDNSIQGIQQGAPALVDQLGKDPAIHTVLASRIHSARYFPLVGFVRP